MVTWLSFFFCLAGFSGPVFASSAQQLQSLGFEEFSQKAPEIRFKGASGKEFRLSTLQEGRFVLLHLWATWCSSCVEEMPRLNDYVKKWKEPSIMLLAVSVDGEDQRAAVKDFLARHKIDGEPFIVEEDAQSKQYYAWGIPMTYLIDPKGKIIARGMGAQNWDPVSKGKFSAFLKDYSAKTKK